MTSGEPDRKSDDREDIPKGEWPIAGGRCHPDDLYLIDRAALEVRETRSEFVVGAALERARIVLAAKGTAATAVQQSA